jgi:hypothetical protein
MASGAKHLVTDTQAPAPKSREITALPPPSSDEKPLKSETKPETHQKLAAAEISGQSAPKSAENNADSNTGGQKYTDGSPIAAGEKAASIPAKIEAKAEVAVIGTAVAQSSQRMNLSAERNEIAGQTEQKLPPGSMPAVAAVDAGGASGHRKTKPSLQFDWSDSPAQILTIMDPSGKAVHNAREIEGAHLHAPAGGGQLDRIEMLITREAANIRENGAERLGVSVKVDAQTELFLQLTQKDGQLQATLRCERGDFSALDSQWAQLQQTLARQNVQLMPLGDGASSNFQQPAERRQPQLPPGGEEGPVFNSAVEPKQTRKPKQPGRSRQRWESWA